MSVWYRQYGSSRASKHTLAILGRIESYLTAVAGPCPPVTSVRIGAGPGDQHDFEVEVELAAGVTLAVRYQSVDEEARDPGALEDQGGAVAWLVAESVKEFMGHGAPALADVLHDLRLRTRRTLACWWAEGIHATLEDIRSVRAEHAGPDDDLAVEARLRHLDDRLRPAIRALEAATPDLLGAQIESCKPEMARRSNARAELARHGADGWVDQLALNAIAQRDEVGPALRMIASGRPYGLSEELTVFVRAGHVRCHGWDEVNPSFSWNRDSVIIHGKSVPAVALTALVGRPVSHLVEHPVLSDDMIVTEATARHEYGLHSVRADFEQPRRLFCSASGRVWDP